MLTSLSVYYALCCGEMLHIVFQHLMQTVCLEMRLKCGRKEQNTTVDFCLLRLEC